MWVYVCMYVPSVLITVGILSPSLAGTERPTWPWQTSMSAQGPWVDWEEQTKVFWAKEIREPRHEDRPRAFRTQGKLRMWTNLLEQVPGSNQNWGFANVTISRRSETNWESGQQEPYSVHCIAKCSQLTPSVGAQAPTCSLQSHGGGTSPGYVKADTPAPGASPAVQAQTEITHVIFSKRNPGGRCDYHPHSAGDEGGRGTERWSNLDLRSYSSKRWGTVSNASSYLQGPHCPLSLKPCPCCGAGSVFLSYSWWGSELRASTRGTWYTSTTVAIVSWSKGTTSSDGEWIIFITAVDILSTGLMPICLKVSILQLHFAFFVTQGISSQCDIRSSREGLRRSRQCSEPGGGRPSIFLVQEQSSVP